MTERERMNAILPEASGAATGPDDGTAGPGLKGVLCVKCETLNDRTVDRCRKCSAHLFVFCHRCGEKNPRVNSRCEGCRRSLHRGISRALRGAHTDISLLAVGVGALVILIVLAVLIWASNFRG